MKKLFALIVLLFPLNGCFSDSQADASVSFSTLLSGSAPVTGPFGNRKIVFFRNQLALDEAIAQYSQSPAEQTDFNVSQVVLIDIGQRSTGGYSVKVTSVRESDSVLQMEAIEVSPGANCIVTQSASEAFTFAKIESVKRIETISVKLEVVDC